MSGSCDGSGLFTKRNVLLGLVLLLVLLGSGIGVLEMTSLI